MNELRGDRVRLRPLAAEDVPQLVELQSQASVARWWGEPEDGHYDQKLDGSEGVTAFVIEVDGELAGLIQFHEEDDPRYRSAGIDLFVGEGFQGLGVGTDAIRMLARHLVQERGHHRLTIDPSAENEAAIRAYEKVGFRPVGVMRRYEFLPEGRGRTACSWTCSQTSYRIEAMATIETNSELGQQIVEDAKRYVLYSWSVQDAINPIAVSGGEGRYFWDYDGKRYLDFASQLVNLSLGHQHPRIVAAIKEQAEQLTTIGPPMASESRSKLGRLLAEVTPGDLAMSFFTNGGAEANENAIKLARWYTGRHKIVARYRSYHGATGGAITLTGDPRRWHAEPGIPGVVRMLDPYTYRCPAGHPDPCPVCSGAPHLEEILQYEGPQTVAAVILETVVGTNGIIIPPDDYLQSIREVCDRHGILLICDEVMAGFGRTGKWFACENWDVVPDILTVAKGINSGYVPLGAMIVRQEIADWVRDKYFAGGLTYSGHPLACASAVASIETFRDEGIVEHAAELGPQFAERLHGLAEKHPSIGEVRGLGCFWGLELVRDRETREPLVPFNATGADFAPVAQMAKAALDRGLYLMTHWNVVMVCPPLNVTLEELDEGIAILDEALSVADEFVA